MALEQTRFTVLGLNPNDVATFIVVVILSLPVLLKWSRHWIWFVGPTEAVLIALLVGSGSRGGMLALICSSILALILCWRMGSWPKGWKIWTGIALVILLGAGAGLAAFPKGFRLGTIDISPEASAGRRLEVWSTVPDMMVAAPAGWGMGHAAEAYELWFEPVGQGVELKHLLSSHLTWLVEFGWPLRWLYLFLWITAFLLLLPNRRFDFPFWGVAVLTAFFVAIFYNAAGKWWNWPIPVVWLVAALFFRFRQKIFPYWPYWVVSLLISGLLVGFPFLQIRSPSPSVREWNNGNIVLIGAGNPNVAILGPSTDVLGKFYGQEIRQEGFKPSQEKGSVVIVKQPEATANSYLAGCHIYVISGADEAALEKWQSFISPKSDATLVLINCRLPMTDWLKGFGHVIYCHGDFYGDPHYREWKDLASTNSAVLVKDIPRHGAYVADWWPLLNEGAGK